MNKSYLPEVIPGRDRLPWHGCASFLARWLLLSVPRCSCFFSLSLLDGLSSHLSPPALSLTRTRVTWSISPPCFTDDGTTTIQRAPTWQPDLTPRPHSIDPEDQIPWYCVLRLFLSRVLYRMMIKGNDSACWRTLVSWEFIRRLFPNASPGKEYERRENYGE